MEAAATLRGHPPHGVQIPLEICLQCVKKHCFSMFYNLFRATWPDVIIVCPSKKNTPSIKNARSIPLVVGYNKKRALFV